MHTALAAAFAAARASGGGSWLAAASATSNSISGGAAQFNTPGPGPQPCSSVSPVMSTYTGIAADHGTPWLGGNNGRAGAPVHATPVHVGSGGAALYTPAPAICSGSSSFAHADRTPDAPGTPAGATAPPPVIKGAGAGAPRRGRSSTATAAATPHSAGPGGALLSELRAPRSSILRSSGAGDGGDRADETHASGGSALSVRRSARFSLMTTPSGPGGHGDAAGEEEVPRAKKQHMATTRTGRPTSAGQVNNTGGASVGGGGGGSSGAAPQSPSPGVRADFTAAVGRAARARRAVPHRNRHPVLLPVLCPNR
jgi:hypothetical protein